MLPQNTILGTLEYIEVYDFYDAPQFFSCKNEKGEIYLGLSVDDEPLTYVFVRVDSNTLELAKDKNILPTNILWWYSYQKYKVEFLSIGDVVTFISTAELGFLFTHDLNNGKLSTI